VVTAVIPVIYLLCGLISWDKTRKTATDVIGYRLLVRLKMIFAHIMIFVECRTTTWYSRSYVYSETSRWTYDRTTGLAKVGHIPMTVSMKWYPVTADIPAAAYAMGTKETVANVMDY